MPTVKDDIVKMTSRVDSALDSSSSITKLPQINSGGSLVSPIHSARSSQPSPQEKAQSWAQDVRQKLSSKLEKDEEVEDGDINILKTEFLTAIITALQKDDRPSWQFLREVIILTEPFKQYLAGKLELQHYLERLRHHLDVNKERLFDIQVTEALNNLFSKDLQKIEEANIKPKKNYCPPTPPRSLAPSLKRPSPKMLLPDGKDPFKLERPEDNVDKRPKGLTFGDLRSSLSDVALEMATREAIWSACVGTTASALMCDLPEMDESDLSPDVYPIEEELLLETPRDTPREEEKVTTARDGSPDPPARMLNGRDAVEFFSKCYHTGQIEFMYFNVAPNRHFKPYDLVQCQKVKANPEHFVFSTFGVLHVFPDKPADNQSLAEWQQEAVLFNAVSKIPFFKNYLLRKMFTRWRANVHFADYSVIRKNVSEGLLQAVPSFGAALLQVSKLCQELLQLKFLPLEKNKCFQLGEFENVVNYMNLQAEKILDRFFRYNKIIVDTTSEESFKKLKHAEEQARHKTVFTKESLHLQKMKKRKRALNLARAKEETSRLGNFVKLVDQLLLASLVKIARTSVMFFVNETMQPPMEEDVRDGLFGAKLVFGNKDNLTISPGKEKFLKVLSRTLGDIPFLLCNAATPMDGSASKVDDNFSESNLHESPVSKSTRDLSMKGLMKDPKKNRRSVIATTSKSVVSSSARGSSASMVIDNAGRREKDVAGEGRDILTSPMLHRELTPTKSIDNLGQATPDLIRPDPLQENLKVTGRGFMGQYNPLNKGNLEEKLANDEAYQESVQVQAELMKEAITEIDEYCEKNSWLNEIYVFCKTWNSSSVKEWKGAAAFTIEQKLSEIRQWSEKVRLFDKTYTTDNCIFFVDCTGVQDFLLPRLNNNFKELCSFVADESADLAKRFCSEMSAILANMKDKQTDIGSFATYAKNVSKYKKNQPHYRERVEYIKSLFEVIRMSYRQLEPEEEKMEENVLAQWDAFLVQMQDAMEFVNTQTPLITQNLEDTYQKLEEQAKVICDKATTGKFLDPSQNPTHILMDMRKLREEFYDIQKQMQQASKWKEAITSEPYDLSFLNSMASKMDIRQELWKYVEVSTHAIQEWKCTLFKKLNAKKAIEKIIEWQAAAGQIKEHIPPGDEVLTTWYRALIEFKQDLPLLHKLSNDALKPRHWKAIFLGMGESYEASHQFTVEELLSYNLGAHNQVINTIYSAAVSEFAIEQKLVKIRKLWEEKDFKLAKHIPDSIYKDENTRAKSPPQSRKIKRFEKFRMDKNAGQQQKILDLRAEQLYLLIEVEELKYLLEDSAITLQTMLASPFLADHRKEAERWSKSLGQVEEIVDLWSVCQKKWLFLLKIFEDPDIFRRMGDHSMTFENMHLKFIEVMQAVISDPKVTSMFSKNRGDKGYRPHQGDRLQVLFVQLIGQQEEVLKHLSHILDRARAQFPRLYFLSDIEMVEILGISRNPRALLPFVKKCFSGVEDLTFSLPVEMAAATLNSALDIALNANKLEVTKIHGAMGEELPLHCRLEAYPQATTWLSNLEHSIKSTVMTVMEACVQARLEDGSKQTLQLLEEVAKFEKVKGGEEAEEIKMKIHYTFSHWILRFPAQCVLTAEAVMWERSVFRALERQDKHELQSQRMLLSSRIEQYIKVLRENCQMYMTSDMRQRLHCLLGCLVSQGLHHRDVIDHLLANKNLSEGAFDWLRELKYHMEIRNVLRAKTESSNVGEPARKTSKARADSFDDLQVQRAMTTVSSGYQFGQCMVSQMGANFAYDQEYLGPGHRLIFTPLTERAYLTLTMALKSFNCGTLIGPPGTGKSETIKDLGKALGRHVVQINCSEELTLPKMNQFLNGMIQSGCWALFDHTDRMTMGLMSVFGQHLDHISNAMRVLDSSSDNQYGIRGQPRFDKKTATKTGEKKIRRNSLTTLHSLPPNQDFMRPTAPGGLDRQTTVPHGFNEEGLITYFEDPWVKERERRHSIEKEIEIKESELYKTMRPPPLFYEQVTAHRKPKMDYKDLVPSHVAYKPSYIGNVLFNGKLVKANSNYGCFMTLNTMNPLGGKIPDNLRACMRPCALVVPDTRMVIETTLYCNGFQQYQILTNKMAIFMEILTTQMPRKQQYNFGLKTLMTILEGACRKLHSQMHTMYNTKVKELKRQPSLSLLSRTRSTEVAENAESQSRPSSGGSISSSDSSTSITDSPNMKSCEEGSILQALNMVLKPKMVNTEDLSKLRNLIRDVFPSSSRPKSGIQAYSPALVTAVENQMRQDNLQPTPEFVNKVLQLYSALQLKQGVILSGLTGSGKSSVYKVLAKVLTKLSNKENGDDKIDDELVPDRNLQYQYGQKLKKGDKLSDPRARHLQKILREVEPRAATTETKKAWRKVGKLTSITQQLYAMVEDDVDEPDYPKVDMAVLFPNASPPHEFFGGFGGDGQWKNGILTTVLKNAYFQVESAKHYINHFDEKKNKAGIDTPAIINKWIVLDGALNPVWVDSMNTLLGEAKTLSLSSGEKVKLQDATSIIMEVADLTNASPSSLANSCVVHCCNDTVTWKAMIESWTSMAKQRWLLNTLSLQVISSLVSTTFATTLNFLAKECCPALVYNLSSSDQAANQVNPCIQEVSSFLKIFSAFLDRHFLREDFEQEQENKSKTDVEPKATAAAPDTRRTESSNGPPPATAESGRSKPPSTAESRGQAQSRMSSLVRMEDSIPNYMVIIKAIFGFSYVWGFGGQLHDSCFDKFDEFARETLRRASQPIVIPDGGSVFDYILCPKSGTFCKWSEKPMEKVRNLPPTYSVTPQVDRYHFLIDLMLSNNTPVLITGDPGVGKTSLITNLVPSKHPYTRVMMSPGYTSNMLQNTIETRVQGLQQANTDAMGKTSKTTAKHLFFIEDLNTASADKVSGLQPPLELMRQLIKEKIMYDKERQVTVAMEDVDFIAATTTPGVLGSGHGYASSGLSCRLTYLFAVFNMFSPNENIVHSLFTKTVQSWLEEFPTFSVEHHAEFARALVQGAIDVYSRVRANLRPTPANAHYVFTLHDISRILDGVMLMSPRSKIKPKRGTKSGLSMAQSSRFSSIPSTGGMRVSSANSTNGAEAKGSPPMMRVIARLWCHEVTRIFGDRITGHEDQGWFENTVEEVVLKNFCTGASDNVDIMSVIQEDSMSQRVTTPFDGTSPSPDPEPTPTIKELDTETSSKSSHTSSPLPTQEKEQAIPGVLLRDDSDLSLDSAGAHQESGISKGMSRERSLLESAVKEEDEEEETEEDKAQDSGATLKTVDSSSKETLTTSTTSVKDDASSDDQSDDSSTDSSDDESMDESRPTSADTGAAASSQAPPTAGEPASARTQLSSGGVPASSASTNHSQRKPTHIAGLKSGSSSSLTRKPSRAGGKRGVTFKTGLIADREVEKYSGPLMTIEQIRDYGESLTEFVFSKYIMNVHADMYGLYAEKGYIECNEDHLAEALYSCLHSYSRTMSQSLNLVFFREAVLHAARLSRVMATAGGHALLLGVGQCSGRATLVRLATHFSNCKLFEPKVQGDGTINRTIVREHMKRCSKSAAFHGKQIVLLLHEDLGDESIKDLGAFIKEGTCPGLYTDEEIQNIATQMTPGQVKITRLDKIDLAYGKFLKRVKQNLHAVVLLNYTGGATFQSYTPLHNKLAQFPWLLTEMRHIDLYQQWSHEAYVTIAEHFLRDQTTQIPIPWADNRSSEQIHLMSIAMAYIHNSAKRSVEKLYIHERIQYKFFTPLTFMEFLHIFRVISAHVGKEEKTKIGTYESGLSKINEAFDSISTYRREVSNLVPRQRMAQTVVQDHVRNVELQREQYIEALDRCKLEEERIERMLSPLEALRHVAHAEFNKINPTYQAALKALESLSHKDLEELKSYRCPPAMVAYVMEAVCLLFKRARTWEEAKGLLLIPNFFQELEFYDKDNIPEDIFKELAVFYNNPQFTESNMRKISAPASGLCLWVRAVYLYAEISRKMKPKLKELLSAEDDLNRAQALLGEKRVEANSIKSALEHEIKSHKQAVSQAKTIEGQIKVVERKIAKANKLMENMSMQNNNWRSDLKQAKSKLKSAPGDALLTAACVCYHGPLDNRTRADLMNDWLNRCELGNFDPSLRLGRQIKPVSLSAKLDSLMMKPSTVGATDSVHSIQQADVYQTEATATSYKGDDTSSIHETERASSASSMPQLSVYKHHPSVYDTGSTFKTELRVLDNVETNLDTESIDANSSVSSRNLLAVRENFTLQDVLSSFVELSEWKLKGLNADVHSLHNALIMRVSSFNRKHCWPLLVDPDGQAEIWVQALQDSKHIIREHEIIRHIVEQRERGGGRNRHHSGETTHTISEYNYAESQDGGVSEYETIGDSTHIPDPESRATTRQNVPIADTPSEDFRAVTSVTVNQEMFSANVDENIDRPENNLWVVQADNVNVHTKIVNAVVHGVTLLITHVERKPLDSLFRGLLLRHFTVDKDGHKVVRVGDNDFKIHPNFCLYLSTSVPLFLKGDGIAELPIHRMCVVDMSTSQEGVIDRLLYYIMQTERPEFEGQRKSIEADLLNHQHQLNNEHALIMNKTLALDTPLLQDGTMLDALLHCQKNVASNKMILEETQYLREHLEEKRAPYIPVARHGAKLYEIVQRCSVLNPLYHMSLDNFIRLYAATIRGRNRGKGSTGSTKARAQELINATTTEVYHYVSSMMFRQHIQLFVLLVTLERLRMAQQLTNQELGMFVNGVDTSEIEDTMVFDDKPDWLSNKVWLDCAALETTMSSFRGLRDSLVKHADEWQEYFKCPVVLINTLPGDQLEDLTVFQKCLLWRICAPNKMWELSEELVLFELGGVVPEPENCCISNVYANTNKSVPVVFILPSEVQDSNSNNDSAKGHIFANPSREIVHFAKEMGMEGKVHIVTFGVSSQMQEIKHALMDCMKDGYWLILQNAHLADQWGDDMLALLKQIILSRVDDLNENVEEEESEGNEGGSTYTKMTTPPQREEDVLHKDFRLFVTTRANTGRLIPGILTQNGYKVTCEMTYNFKSTVKSSVTLAEKLYSRRDKAAIEHSRSPKNTLPLALLYSLLIHRRNYGKSAFATDNFWSHVDVAAVIEQCKIILTLCQRHKGIPEMTQQILGGHCVDIQDRKVVEALVKAVMLSPKDITKLDESSPGVAGLLAKLIPLHPSISISEQVDSLVDVSTDTISLPASAEIELQTTLSRNILDDLVRVIGAPDLISTSLELSNRKAELILQEVWAALDGFPNFPKTSADSMNPLELFFHTEVQIFKDTLGRVYKDTIHLLRVVHGELPATEDDQQIFLTISQHKTPASWEGDAYPACLPLTQWVANIKHRIETLSSYIENKEGVVSYNMAVFNRPDRFIQCVLRSFVRRQFKDLHTCKLDVQFLPVDINPSSPPTQGVYVTGLHLHNAEWDSTRSILKQTHKLTSSKMPLIWLKPLNQAEFDKARAAVKHGLYDCPIYYGSGTDSMGWQNIVASLQVPTVVEPSVWTEKRVHMNCQLNMD